MTDSVAEHGLRSRKAATGARYERKPFGVSVRKEDATMDA